MSVDSFFKMFISKGRLVVKTLVTIFGLALVTWSVSASACEISDVSAYFTQLAPGSNCTYQGGVKETVVQRGELSITGKAGMVFRSLSMVCNNGDTLLGMMSLDVKTCQVRSVSWDTTARL